MTLLTTSDISINKVVFNGTLNYSSIIVGPSYGIAFSGSGTAILASSGVGSTVGTASIFGVVTGNATWSLAANAGGKYAIHSSSGAVTVAAGLANSTDSVTIHVTNISPSVSDATFSWTVGTAPANTVAPAISGSAIQGVTLAGSTGTWTGFPTPSTSPQWKRGTVSIPGATSINYTVQNADVGTTLALAVTGSNVFGSATATSSATATTTKVTLSYSPVTTAIQSAAYTGATPTATGGTAPYVYSIGSGVLPVGLSVNTSNGIITGIPTTLGTSSGLTLVVTDVNSVIDTSSSFSIEVTSAPAAPILYVLSVVNSTVTFGVDIASSVFTAGNTLNFQIQTSALTWVSPVVSTTHVITAGEVSAGEVDLSFRLGIGTFDARTNIAVGGSTSAWSNVQTFSVTTASFTPTFYIYGF